MGCQPVNRKIRTATHAHTHASVGWDADNASRGYDAAGSARFSSQLAYLCGAEKGVRKGWREGGEGISRSPTGDNFDSSHLAETFCTHKPLHSLDFHSTFVSFSFFFLVLCAEETTNCCRKGKAVEEGAERPLSVRVLKTFVGGQFHAVGLFI